MSGDIYYNSVSLLLHFDGTNGSTTFTDTGPLAKTVTANASAQIATAQSVFGGASGRFGGADWISIPAYTGVQFDAGDFTVEGRIRFDNTAAATEFICGNYDASGTNASCTFSMYRTAAGKLTATGFNGSSQVAPLVSTTTLAAGTWYAFAYVRQGSNFYLFINGTQEATATSATTLNVSTNTFSIGRGGAFASSYMTGYVDEFRITKAIARYFGSAYTLATGAFPDVVEIALAEIVAKLPKLTGAIFAGGRLVVPVPKLTGAIYAGALLPVVVPKMTGGLNGGALMGGVLPSLKASITGHDSTGERAIFFKAPKLQGQMYGGATLRGKLPKLTGALSATSTAMAQIHATLPKFTGAMSGTAGGEGKITATLPKMTGSGRFGGILTVSLSPLTGSLSSTGGSLGRIIGKLPMFQAVLVGTAQPHGEITAVLPSMQPAAGGRIVGVLPKFMMVAIGHAVVTATYEAYALNLKHQAVPGIVPVDEMTHYTNFPFDRIVRWGSDYYGMAGDGLYLLFTGTTDFGSVPITYDVQTHMTDFGTPLKKTVVSAYFGGRLGTNATITLRVGEIATKVYTFTTPRGVDAQNYRQKFGLGTKARYFAIEAAGAGAFDSDVLEFNVAQMTRRI